MCQRFMDVEAKVLRLVLSEVIVAGNAPPREEMRKSSLLTVQRADNTCHTGQCRVFKSSCDV